MLEAWSELTAIPRSAAHVGNGCWKDLNPWEEGWKDEEMVILEKMGLPGAGQSWERPPGPEEAGLGPPSDASGEGKEKFSTQG